MFFCVVDLVNDDFYLLAVLEIFAWIAGHDGRPVGGDAVTLMARKCSQRDETLGKSVDKFHEEAFVGDSGYDSLVSAQVIFSEFAVVVGDELGFN